jgi:hypothetical protein
MQHALRASQSITCLICFASVLVDLSGGTFRTGVFELQRQMYLAAS